MMQTFSPTSVDAVQAAVREARSVAVAGGRTKPGLVPECHAVLEMGGLSGVLDYEPTEFVITVLAGTPLKEITATLLEHGQYLPFDPYFVAAGATAGGTVASGLSGPGRYRYGGLRDFIIGVRYVDGTGTVIRGGGKVVKNAAGFDLPKLMVGSLGRLGVLTEIGFKVFPKPTASRTLVASCDSVKKGAELVQSLSGGHYEPDALELDAGGRVYLRVAGDAGGLDARVSEVQSETSGLELMDDAAADDWWRSLREFDWAAESACLIKVPLTSGVLGDFEGTLPSHWLRHYGTGGNVAYVGLPDADELSVLDGILTQSALPGLVLRSNSAASSRRGPQAGAAMESLVTSALDPQGTFSPIETL